MTPRSPVLMPKKKLQGRSVHLEPDLWPKLDEIAQFETKVFQALGELEEDSSISRNEVIGSFLEWALRAYWDARGGHPETEREKSEKLRTEVETRKRQPK